MNIKSLKSDITAEYGLLDSRKILLNNHVLDSVLHNLKGHITNFLHLPIFCQPLGAFLRKYGISTQTWVENTPKIPSRSMVLYFQIATAEKTSKISLKWVNNCLKGMVILFIYRSFWFTHNSSWTFCMCEGSVAYFPSLFRR